MKSEKKKKKKTLYYNIVKINLAQTIKQGDDKPEREREREREDWLLNLRQLRFNGEVINRRNISNLYSGKTMCIYLFIYFFEKRKMMSWDRDIDKKWAFMVEIGVGFILYFLVF